MADSIKDIRAKTSAKIAELDRKREEEIRALESEYRKQMEALRAESWKKQEEYNRRLAELDAKLRTQVAAGQRDLAEQTRRLAADLSRKLTAIERETNEALEKREKELRARIDRKYREIEERIRELFERLASQDEQERLYAERCLRRAEEQLRLAQGSETVREFNEGMLEPLARSHRELDALCKQKLWTAIGSSALMLDVECQRTLIEAEERLLAWTNKNGELMGRLMALRERIDASRTCAWSFHHREFDYTCALLEWNQAAFEAVEQALAELEKQLRARPRCTMDDMTGIGVSIAQERDLLDAAMTGSQQRVGAFLMIAQLMSALTQEVPMADSAWSPHEDAMLQPVTNTAEMSFRRSGGSYGELRVTVREQRSPGSGLLMTIMYDGTRSKPDRQREMQRLCAWLGRELGDMRYGGLSLGNAAPFTDGSLVGVNIPVDDQPVEHGVWSPEAAEESDTTGAGGRSGYGKKDSMRGANEA